MDDSFSTHPDSHYRAARTYQERNRSAGLCVLCPRPSPDYNLCAYHRELERVRRERRRAKAGRVASDYTCSACKQKGHNKRACPNVDVTKMILPGKAIGIHCRPCNGVGHTVNTCPQIPQGQHAEIAAQYAQKRADFAALREGLRRRGDTIYRTIVRICKAAETKGERHVRNLLPKVQVMLTELTELRAQRALPPGAYDEAQNHVNQLGARIA